MTDTTQATILQLNNLEEALRLSDLLLQNHISCSLELLPAPPENPGNGSASQHILTVALSDSARAKKLILEYQIQNDNYAAERNFLQDLSDDELMDVIAKSDTWGKFHSAAAQKILSERGRIISPAQVAKLENQRREYLIRPRKLGWRWWIVLWFSAFPPGFLGIVAGWHIISQKTVLPNGRKVYAFTYGVRAMGIFVLIAGTAWAIFLIWLCIVRLMGYYPNGLFG